MPRLAYADEYPWHRCSCGWILNSEKNPCPNCGDDSETEYLDRFGRTGDSSTHYGREYRNVPYEDRFKVTRPVF